MRRRLFLCIILQILLLFSIIIPYGRAETGKLEIIEVHRGESGRELAAIPGDRASLIVYFKKLN